MTRLRRPAAAIAGLLTAVLSAACGRDAGGPPVHRGFEAGMPVARCRQAAGAVGPLNCAPFDVEGLAANQLCAATSTAGGLRIVGALGAADSTVPYVVVQEPDSAGGYAALTREWGAPD